MSTAPQPPRTYNQNHAPRKYTPGKTKGFNLLDVELPLGSQPGHHGIRQSLLDHDRGPESRLARV